MEVAEDAVLGGRVRLRQPKAGFRAGHDSILLGAAIALKPGARACELGCGAGAALLTAAVHNRASAFVGIERDARLAALAAENAALNGLDERIKIQAAEALRVEADGREAFDAVFFNPPFFDDPSALRAPAPEKRAAWLSEGALSDWIGAGLARLKPKGILTLIHRADRLADILAALAGPAGDIAIKPIHAKAEGPAKRVLIAARKASKAPLSVLAPLILNGAEGASPEAAAILAGSARLFLHRPKA